MLNFTNFEYFLILFLVTLAPVIFTFHPKNNTKFYFREVFLAIIITSIPFVIWDILATERGHWDFDFSRTLGIKIFNLPLEEVLFFAVVPYTCLFLWIVIDNFKNWPEFIKDLTNK